VNTTAVSITTSDGRVLRYGPDEPKADGIPTGLTYSSTMPGGHDQATFSLSTKISDELPFSLLDDVRIYGPGNRTLWEGYVAQLPRQSGDDFLVNVQCVGHSARLKWDTGFREIYVDRDLSNWSNPSITRRLVITTGGYTHADFQIATDPVGGVPAIQAPINGVWSATSKPLCDPVYDSKGIGLGRLHLDWTATSNVAEGADANWTLHIQTATTSDLTSVVDISGDVAGVAHPVVGAEYVLGGASVAWFQVYYEIAAGVDNIDWSWFFYKIAVIGNHNLPLQGSPSDKGFYGHDILSDVVTRAGSGITTSGIDDNTSFIVRQCAFLTPTTGEDVILDVNKYFLWEWGVWDNKEFFWREPDPGRLTWEARLDQGAHINLEGDESANAINGVIVNYTMADGTTKVAGPVGSGLQLEDASLGDTSSTNPVNAAGIPAKYGKLDVSFPVTDPAAVAIGAAYFRELSLPARKGSISLTGTVNHPTKGPRPVSEVRAGDWIKVTDLTGSSDIPRRIIQASHSPDEASCQVDVGNDIDKVDAILQRVGIATTLVGG
jgi:hypothetical protein